ncbi:metallophosphoesterase family protein [Marinisporobacter balticus]|uniref:DNA repair exonuclease SbcCD nuclease subunit n=1 Tax=Marinisporobacter balticus TaxID=2018667 RepID=A0A4R2K8M5_9FIRM|nr:DNA repair exonuclease [Marinisporobacter balticus]TCO68297.1 DNA repair exonuclease SbcCD nuclease subunit [Marinisporobacter balticus]
MNKVKILHCADLHFDTPFSELSRNKSESRKEDLRETFGTIIELVKKEKVGILFISGDLFDNKRVMQTTLDYIHKKFLEISDTKIFLCPGNHDFYDHKSFYHTMKWPSNVYIFHEKISKVNLAELNTCVYGVGFSKSYERKSLIENFCVDDESYINMMVLHGQVVQKGQKSDYNPITIEDIGRSRLDYLALGHTHKYTGIESVENTFFAYSGCPEGRGFDELGEKGVLIGELGKGYCHLRFQETSKRKYFVKKIDISETRTYEEIIRKINDQIENSYKKTHLYKIHLIGEISEKFSIRTDLIEQKLKEEFYFIKIIDDTQMILDYDALEKEFSLKGIFIRNMREKMYQACDEQEKKRLLKALKFGIKALEGEGIDLL